MTEPSDTHVNVSVGVPEPGTLNTPHITINLEADVDVTLMDNEELKRLLTMAAVTGWGAAFDFVLNVAEQWRANGVAISENFPASWIEYRSHSGDAR